MSDSDFEKWLRSAAPMDYEFDRVPYNEGARAARDWILEKAKGWRKGFICEDCNDEMYFQFIKYIEEICK